MLAAEMRGEAYNKAAHRRALLKRLDGRSDGSVERKHQNISAVLIGIGLPYIDGYKPLSNYQRLLWDAVADYVGDHGRLIGEFARLSSADETQAPPVVADADSVVVEAPDILPQVGDPENAPPRVAARWNFSEIEARNAELGRRGEEFVVGFEQARLYKAGRKDLARRIEWVSDTRGDGLGFDIASFDNDGSDRLIEVKTTKYGISFPFLISRNEISVSEQRREDYCLYRVFGFRRDPHLFMLPGSVSEHCRLEPQMFRASVGSRVA
jgi:hypothetical protein